MAKLTKDIANEFDPIEYDKILRDLGTKAANSYEARFPKSK